MSVIYWVIAIVVYVVILISLHQLFAVGGEQPKEKE